MRNLYNSLIFYSAYAIQSFFNGMQAFWLSITALLFYLTALIWIVDFKTDGCLHLITFATFLGIFLYGFKNGLSSYKKPNKKALSKSLERSNRLPLGSLGAVRDNAILGDKSIWKRSLETLDKKIRYLSWPDFRNQTYNFDKFALRYLALACLVVSLLMHHEYLTLNRLGNAFVPKPQINIAAFFESEPAHYKGWISPPNYIKQLPIAINSETIPPILAWQGAELSLSVTAPDDDQIFISFGSEDDAKALEVVSPNNYSFESVLPDTASRVALFDEDMDVLQSWPIFVEKDQSPTIAFEGKPQITKNGSIKLQYFIQDDHGPKSAELIVSPLVSTILDPNPQPFSVDISNNFIRLDRDGVKIWGGQSFHDFTGHVWSGLPVMLQLKTIDEAGNEAKSKEVELVLPEREFQSVLAKKIIAIRDQLIEDYMGNRYTAIDDLEEIMVRPGEYFNDIRVFLGLKSALNRLFFDRFIEEQRSVVRLLWDIAVYLDEGRLKKERNNLMNAENALKRALQDNQSGSELEQLITNYKRALLNYARASLREEIKDAKREGRRLSPNQFESMALDPKVMEEFFEALSEKALAGDKDDALKMVQELRSMLENMNQENDLNAEQRQALTQMRELQQIIQIQKQLLDKTKTLATLDEKQKQEEGQYLSEMQSELSTMLESLIKDYEALLKDKDNKRLIEAKEHMDEASEQLKQLKLGECRAAQEKALNKLQDGFKQALNKIEQKLGLSISTGSSSPSFGFGQNQGMGSGNKGANLDPFGRPEGQSNRFSKPVDLEDNNKAQKTRDIINELRERASERQREPIELDYLERLLNRF